MVRQVSMRTLLSGRCTGGLSECRDGRKAFSGIVESDGSHGGRQIFSL